MCTVRHWHTQLWMGYLHQPPLRSQGSVWKRKQKDCRRQRLWRTPRKLSSRQKRTGLHINSKRLWQHSEALCRLNPAMRGERGHILRSYPNWYMLAKEKSVFSSRASLGKLITLKSRPHFPGDGVTCLQSQHSGGSTSSRSDLSTEKILRQVPNLHRKTSSRHPPPKSRHCALQKLTNTK